MALSDAFNFTKMTGVNKLPVFRVYSSFCSEKNILFDGSIILKKSPYT